MKGKSNRQQRAILQRIAGQAMLARGLLPDFASDALAELDGIRGPATRAEESISRFDNAAVAESSDCDRGSFTAVRER
jgi:hypothetical protein